MKINYKSVLNNTVAPISAATRHRFPQPSTETAARKPASSLSPTKQDTANDRLKTQVSNVQTTTTAVLSPLVVPSSSSSEIHPSKAPTPLAEAIFHQRLCNAFAAAEKAPPLKSQSVAAYAAIPDDWEGFLAWMPNAPAFQAMSHPGGLRTLIEFYQATKEAEKLRSTPAPVILPTPCAQCADSPIPGFVGRKYQVIRGVFAGEWRFEFRPCDCALGAAKRAASTALHAEGIQWRRPEPENLEDWKEGLEQWKMEA